jgi:hypothetical protein
MSWTLTTPVQPDGLNVPSLVKEGSECALKNNITSAK